MPFVTIEGGEGAGKSTQLRRLADWLGDRGLAVVATREPGGAPGAEEIRRLLTEGEPGRWSPMAEALLHVAARAEHVRVTVRPALDAGKWVLSDRFADSTMAYQGYGHRLGRQAMAGLHEAAIGSLQPDLTLILDLPVPVGLARALARAGAGTRYERMDAAFHERVRAGFLEIARTEPVRCRTIDADRPPDAVAADVIAVVAARFGLT